MPRAACTARSVARAVASAASAHSSSMPGFLPARPVPRVNSVSPSSWVCTGLMLRARPSCAATARRCACALVMTASVATTPMVVLVPASSDCANSPRNSARRVSARRNPSAVRAPATGCAVSGSITSPTALQAMSAPTVTPSTVTEALPMPPFMARAMPNILPTLAPVPAPTLPSAGSAREAAAQAAWPAAASGRMRMSPTIRSNSTAEGTSGSRPTPMSSPTPCSSSQRTAPVAASRPQALPPESITACTFSTRLQGSSRSVSRVPGAAPRTSTPATAPSRAITTLQPVGRRVSVKCPTSIPATRVMLPGSVALLMPWRPGGSC